jgi:hypothetical protein
MMVAAVVLSAVAGVSFCIEKTLSVARLQHLTCRMLPRWCVTTSLSVILVDLFQEAPAQVLLCTGSTGLFGFLAYVVRLCTAWMGLELLAEE